MAFAPPALVAQVALRSPQIQSLPLGLQRAIADAGDVNGPGRYAVSGTTNGLNVRSTALIPADPKANVVATMKEGSKGTSDGTVDNGFAFVQWDDGPSGWSSVAFLAPEAQAPIASAPVSADLPQGSYVVVTKDEGPAGDLSLRSTPAIAQGNVLAMIPKGATVIATGKNQNFFAEVEYAGLKGWASSAYLVPSNQIQQGGQGGVLILSSADALQLRTLLAAWSNATQGAPPYGAPSDFLMNEAASDAQRAEVAAFQKWSNTNKGTSLRTDGAVDAPTRAAILSWSAEAVGSPAGPANTPTGLPDLPPANPVVTDVTPVSDTTPAESSGGGIGIVALLAIAAVAFLVIEEKKRKRAA